MKQLAKTEPRIAKGRELSGLSIAQAAKLLGLSETRLTYFEQKKTKPSLAVLKDMANVYGVSLPWLTGAPPVISKSTHKLLRDSELTADDIDKVEQILGSMRTIEEK